MCYDLKLLWLVLGHAGPMALWRCIYCLWCKARSGAWCAHSKVLAATQSPGSSHEALFDCELFKAEHLHQFDFKRAERMGASQPATTIMAAASDPAPAAAAAAGPASQLPAAEVPPPPAAAAAVTAAAAARLPATQQVVATEAAAECDAEPSALAAIVAGQAPDAAMYEPEVHADASVASGAAGVAASTAAPDESSPPQPPMQPPLRSTQRLAGVRGARTAAARAAGLDANSMAVDRLLHELGAGDEIGIAMELSASGVADVGNGDWAAKGTDDGTQHQPSQAHASGRASRKGHASGTSAKSKKGAGGAFQDKHGLVHLAAEKQLAAATETLPASRTCRHRCHQKPLCGKLEHSAVHDSTCPRVQSHIGSTLFAKLRDATAHNATERSQFLSELLLEIEECPATRAALVLSLQMTCCAENSTAMITACSVT